jgi:solute:Na+ symporter, SSS family
VIHWDQLSVFIVIAAVVTVVGIVASRWRAADLSMLEEWGLAGRRFGTLITWFLLGGDLYTAYTFVAVPALVFGSGALGLFALPYTVIVYPLVFVIMPKLWAVYKARGYVTPSDYVRDRFNSRFLALLVAITGIVATMPYIALQIFGIEVVIAQMGIPVEIALIIAFLALAVFTYVSGLRAPALIAIVKDVMIWIAVLAAVIIIPLKLGGYGAIFSHVPAAKLSLKPAQFAGYSTLAFGSALALFLYPHAITGTLSSKSKRVIERNAALLPAYSLLLGLIALLGYMAIAAGVHPPAKPYGANAAVPMLIAQSFPGWFAGFSFAAIAVGALVPASVMSIAAANLFNRNIWREYIRRTEAPTEEATVSKIVSLLVKVGAVAFILLVPTQYAIYLQLAGGVWIVQTLPAVFLGLYLGWLSRWPTIAGWAVGTAVGTWMLFAEKFASLFPFAVGGIKTTLYIGLVSLILNLIVVLIGSAITLAIGVQRPEAAEYQKPALG